MELDHVKTAMERKGFVVQVFETVKEAADYLDRSIDKVSVGMGGSTTIQEMGLFERLSQHNTVWWHNNAEQKKAYGAAEVRSRAAGTDVYISSANAVSESGQIINIDHTGNRVASCCFGHKRLYIVIGKNKIETTLEKAIWRARNIAAPKNAQRLGVKTPCAVLGDKCYDCTSPDRICRGFLIMEAPVKGQEIEIVLVNEVLGY